MSIGLGLEFGKFFLNSSWLAGPPSQDPGQLVAIVILILVVAKTRMGFELIVLHCAMHYSTTL